MWRRFVDKARSFIRNSPSPPPVASSVASSIPRAIGQPGRYDPSKVDAYNELRNAVKELSVGVAKPITSPAPSTLDEWSKMKPEDLTAEQLEELAKVNFEGSYGQSKDLKKAVEYWTIASSKGSVESKYSLAVCRKDGVGIERDQALALKELEELATKNNHTMAHVSRRWCTIVLPFY